MTLETIAVEALKMLPNQVDRRFQMAMGPTLKKLGFTKGFGVIFGRQARGWIPSAELLGAARSTSPARVLALVPPARAEG